jgi:hypothetical protein
MYIDTEWITCVVYLQMSIKTWYASIARALYNSFFNLFVCVSSFLNSFTPTAGLPATASSPPNVLNAL